MVGDGCIARDPPKVNSKRHCREDEIGVIPEAQRLFAGGGSPPALFAFGHSHQTCPGRLCCLDSKWSPSHGESSDLVGEEPN